MKKKLLFLLFVSLLCFCGCGASKYDSVETFDIENAEDEGICGSDLKWYYKDNVLLICGTGAMADMSSNQYPWFSKKGECLKIIIEEGCTSIGNYAFYKFSSLVDVKIPDSMISIGERAFEGCSQLNNVVLPDNINSIGNNAFFNCESFTSITLPGSLSLVANAAFYSCENLTDIIIPGGLSDFDIRVFSGLDSLTTITVDPDNTNFCSVDGVLFSKDMKTIIKYPPKKADTVYSIPDGVAVISDNAFYGCRNLIDLNFPDGVTGIGESAFAYCINLIDLNLPDSVTDIGSSAFSGCSNLESINIPNNVTNLTYIRELSGATAYGAGPFQYCRNLKSIVLPDNLETIFINTFDGCDNLETIEMSSNTKIVETEGNFSSSFYGCNANIVYR